MAILSDKWIRTQALEHGMIEPFVEAQRRDGVISYGLSSYGYDARVAPERLFDAGLGELAVVRMPGAAVTDDALAAAEHALAAQGTALLVVLGHTQCGALRAATEATIVD